MDISKLTATEVTQLAALTDTFKEAHEQFDIAMHLYGTELSLYAGYDT